MPKLNSALYLQVYSFQRKALQMSGVWEGLLSVQDSGCSQNIAHAGQGTETSQDQVNEFACMTRRRTLEMTKYLNDPSVK